MPARSHTSGPESRLCKDRASEHASRDGHKHRSSSSGKYRAPGSKVYSPADSHGRGSASSFSAGFRIASTVPHSGKVARKESCGYSSHSGTSSKGENAGGSGTGSGSGRGTPSNKTNFQVSAQPNKKSAKRRSPVTPIVPYTNFGSTTHKDESSSESLPDPYLELTTMANEEIRLKEQAEFTARAKLGGPVQNVINGAVKGSVSSPSPRHASSTLATASTRDTQSCSSTSNKGSATPDAVVNTTSPAMGSARGSNRAGSGRASAAPGGPQRPASARPAGPSTSEAGGEGCTCGRAAPGGDSRASSAQRRRPSSSCRDTGNKHARQRYAAVPEQEEDDDEEDETGMPQAVRLPETTADEPETNHEILKRLHRIRMESIARSVKPSNLMTHLREAGYFRYDYSGSTRTTTDNHNLKYGMKKGVERLYLWLSMYSPPESTPKS